jgi:hypothetical protein
MTVERTEGKRRPLERMPHFISHYLPMQTFGSRTRSTAKNKTRSLSKPYKLRHWRRPVTSNNALERTVKHRGPRLAAWSSWRTQLDRWAQMMSLCPYCRELALSLLQSGSAAANGESLPAPLSGREVPPATARYVLVRNHP